MKNVCVICGKDIDKDSRNIAIKLQEGICHLKCYNVPNLKELRKEKYVPLGS